MTYEVTPQNLTSYLETHLPRYLDLLRRMVAVNSFTANPTGVNTLGELTAQAFATLGFEAETVQSVTPTYGMHLVLTRPGTSGRKLGLISHLDTVFPPEEEIRHNFSWREAGDRIYGPGTVDIKGGTVMIYMILEALQKFAPHLFEAVTWVILLNAAEERGSADFGQLCNDRLGPEALAALVFEGGRIFNQTYTAVTSRKGIALYEITVNGKAAHAGSAHTQGANAIVQLADTILRVAALTDYERDLTFNVGTISGGTVTNRVPHQAEARVEMRAFATEVFEGGIAQMLALGGQSTVSSSRDDYACEVKVELLSRVDPWSPNPATDSLLPFWQEAAAALGVKVIREERGGLSDGNHIWRQIPTLDGLGPAGGNAHCSEQSADGSKEQEYANRSSFVPKALLNTLAILNLISATKL